jgi:thiamine-monophosphate kinase
MAALSDLAAMAARPVGVLVALAVPEQWDAAVEAIADGIGEACAAAHAPIVGGNLTRAAELSITTTVLGAAYAPLRRSAVRAGDLIYATGTFGGPGAALRSLIDGQEPTADARARFARPQARIAESRWLAEQGAHAAIDVSDGLAADLGHLAAASGVRLEVALDALPCLPGVSSVAAAASGEEYELVVAAPAALDGAAFARRFGAPLTAIGRAVEGAAGVVLTLGGARVAPAHGHDHFSQ